MQTTVETTEKHTVKLTIEVPADEYEDGLPVCYTIDAGPNVHVLCPSQHSAQVTTRLAQIPGVERLLTARPGGATRLIESPTSTSQFTNP
jgi:mevalonate pyrophosphate decarboxylase